MGERKLTEQKEKRRVIYARIRLPEAREELALIKDLLNSEPATDLSEDEMRKARQQRAYQLERSDVLKAEVLKLRTLVTEARELKD